MIRPVSKRLGIFVYIWSVRLTVRTLPFQGRDASSILVRTTKNNAGERVEARSVKPLLVGSIPTNGTKTKDADIAQLVRAGRLYRQGCGFKSRYRYKTRMSYNGITGHFQCSDEGSIPFIRSKRLMFQSTRNDEG